MEKQTILVVDDEEDIRELVKYNLDKEGYQVLTAETGETALQVMEEKKPDMVILDLMLPGVDGLEVCKRIRKKSQSEQVPIIMLTAKGEESDVVTGLELGADDYITKPFSPKVMVARVRTIFRRNITGEGDSDEKILKVHDINIDPARFEVHARGKKIELTYTEFNTLYILAKQPGRVYNRYQIVDAIRGQDYAVTDRSVDVQIVSLRKKLGACGQYIETVRGVGYRMKGV